MRMVDKEDFVEIDAWLAHRHAPVLDESFYPKCGMIVPGIAAGFLITTDTSIALLDHFVSNPKAKISERRAAIVDIAESLEAVAREAGFTRIIAFTRNEAIMKNAMKNGYSEIGHCEMLGKELYGSG